MVCLERLRKSVPKGTELTVVVKHVARSGMSRRIMVLLPCEYEGTNGKHLTNLNISSLVADLLGYPYHEEGSVRVDGYGMDMGFHLVYTLGQALWDDGYALKRNWA